MEVARILNEIRRGKNTTYFGLSTSLFKHNFLLILSPEMAFFQVSNYNERVSFTAEKNETHVSSTMTIQAARPRDTGLYTCYLPLFGELEVKQYIYVYSNKKIKMPNTFFDTRNFNREEFLYRWA